METQNKNNTEKTKKGYNVTMSKKRFNQISEALRENIQDEQLVLLLKEKICQIFNFDPDAPAYNPEYGLKQMEARKQKALEQGKTVYELYRKPYYDSKKTDV